MPQYKTANIKNACHNIRQITFKKQMPHGQTLHIWKNNTYNTKRWLLTYAKHMPQYKTTHIWNKKMPQYKATHIWTKTHATI